MGKWYLIWGVLLLTACHSKTSKQTDTHVRTITDALQREVTIPDTVKKIVCIRASAIRLVCYAGGMPFICGVEEQETRDNHFTHLFACPELKQKPIIGPSMGGDPELMMSVQPDVIFMSSTTPADADALQQRTGIPVVTLEYGDMGKKRSTFFHSLRLIGEVLHTQEKVDSLTRFIDQEIRELRQRSSCPAARPKVYIGGISYKGQKGITSTDPYYAAFRYLNVYNVASEIDSTHVSPITGTYIDWEQLADWNPDVIFVDMGGWSLVREDFSQRKNLNRLLKAWQNRQIYTLWPYNNNHTNFEVMLMNAWYAGKALFPERFRDISITQKTDEILTHFLGQPVGRQLRNCWGNYQNVFDTLYEQ